MQSIKKIYHDIYTIFLSSLFDIFLILASNKTIEPTTSAAWFLVWMVSSLDKDKRSQIHRFPAKLTGIALIILPLFSFCKSSRSNHYYLFTLFLYHRVSTISFFFWSSTFSHHWPNFSRFKLYPVHFFPPCYWIGSTATGKHHRGIKWTKGNQAESFTDENSRCW